MRPEQTDQFSLHASSPSSSSSSITLLAADPSNLDADTSISELNHRRPSTNSATSSPSSPPIFHSAPKQSPSSPSPVFHNKNAVQSSTISPINNQSSSVRSSASSTNQTAGPVPGPTTPKLVHHKLDFLTMDKISSASVNNSRDNNNVNAVPRLTFSPETPPATQVDNNSPFSSPSRLSGTNKTFNMNTGRVGVEEGGSGGSSRNGSNHHPYSALLNGTHPNGLSSGRSEQEKNSSVFNGGAGNVMVNGNVNGGENSTAGAGLGGSGVAGGNHSHSSSFSTEENFECVGEGPESFLESHSENTSLQFSRDVSELSSLSVPGDSSGAPPIRRNSWLRTSLRKSPQQSSSSPNGETMGHRRWGSFRNSSGSKRVPPVVTSSSALANHLYRSSSFHSSGRSSAGDGEEMYSDGSLEDEVIDLTQKVHHLEEKFSVLAENQTDVDDRYVRIKQENAELSTKLFMAEESLRDVEQRAEEKLKDEQRRFKDLLARSEREKQLQIENYDIRLRSSEKDLEQAKNELGRLKQKLERERQEKNVTREKLLETERELANVREDHRALMDALRKERDTYLLEAKTAQQALLELKKEFELSRKQPRHHDVLSSSSSSSSDPHRLLGGHATRFGSVDSESETAELKSRLAEFEEENRRLKQENRQLQEANEELNAQILNHGLEEGRHLLTVNRNMGDMGNSLAAEFEAMSQEQLKKALKEQTEVNDQLRTYIDGILLNIVENYPQLLEVKNKPSNNTPDNSLQSSN